MTTCLSPRPTAVTTVARNISQFRATVNESFVPLHISSSKADGFGGIIRGAAVDQVHITDLRATSHVVERTPELIARGGREFFKVSLMLSGTGLLIQDRREAVLRAGDFAIYDTNRPYSLAFDDEFHTMVVMFPKHLIGVPSDIVNQLTAVQISGTEGIGAMVVPYLTQLAANLGQLHGIAGTRLTQIALDMFTTVVLDELDLNTSIAEPHRAITQRIRTHIDHNLASADLTPASIAAAHYISTRHLHALFQEQGTTVSTWIRTRRLDRCRHDLADPLLGDQPVMSIAGRWGFTDAAYFSRVFKAAYGLSPSQFRVVQCR